MPTSAGTRHPVPRAAYQVAMAAFAGTYDPAAAARVPVADGGTFPPPAEAAPDAVVEDVVLSVAEDGRLTFVALGDPDGAGPQPGTYLTYTVVEDGTGWATTQP